MSLAVMGEQKSNLSCGFKLGPIRPITTSTYNLLWKYCENVVDVALLSKLLSGCEFNNQYLEV